MATIKQIAEITNVSRGTIDRVLNNRGGISPETEKKVRAAMEALNYLPIIMQWLRAGWMYEYLCGFSI